MSIVELLESRAGRHGAFGQHETSYLTGLELLQRKSELVMVADAGWTPISAPINQDIQYFEHQRVNRKPTGRSVYKGNALLRRLRRTGASR